MLERQKWQREMESIYLRYHAQSSHDITGLYIDIEKASKKYFEAKEMKEGDRFTVSLTNGAKLEFEFYPRSTALYMQDVEEHNERETLIGKSDDADKEYSQLKALGSMLRMTGEFIGEKYPDEMRDLLLSLEPGEVISFTDGRTYACDGIKNDTLSLIQVYDGNMINLRPECFSKDRNVSIKIYEGKDLQEFYNKNCKYLTERLEYNITKLEDAEKTIKAAEEQVKETGSKAFHMGNISLLAKASKDGSSITWYDNTSRMVDREDIVLLNAILNNQIKERKYIRDTHGVYDLSDDRSLEEVLEVLSVKREYANMYSVIEEHVKKNNGVLTLDFNFFKKESDVEYTPLKVSFISRDGIVKCCATAYKDNDFAKDISYIRELSMLEFKQICEKLYEHNHEILRTRTQDVLYHKFIKDRREVTKTQQQIIENAAERQLKNNEPSMVPFKFSVTDKDVVELIENVNNHKNEISAKDILKRIRNNEDYER